MALDEKINLIPRPVDFLEVYKKLSREYFAEVERLIQIKLPQTVLIHGQKFEGAKEVIDSVLKDSVQRLHEIFLGAEICWEDTYNIKPTYKECPRVVVDIVDGSRELRRGGTEVASTLALVMDDAKDVPLVVISYPFGRERIIDINEKVYRLPNLVIHELDNNPSVVEKYVLPRRESRATLSELRVSERYWNFVDTRRKKLDELRLILDAKMAGPFGSLTKSLMYLVVGTCDIFVGMNKNAEPYHFYDVIASSKVITDLGGVFVDLDGNERKGFNDMNGIIAASTKENYNLFMDFMRGK